MDTVHGKSPRRNGRRRPERRRLIESIANAQAIAKTIRSRSRTIRHAGEKLYVIKSFSYNGTLIYTNGAIVRKAEREVLYVFVSAKTATLSR